jgi:tetratricopeptide (TPR) repeat protein
VRKEKGVLVRVTIGVVGVGLAVMMGLPGCERRQPPMKVKQEAFESKVEVVLPGTFRTEMSAAEPATRFLGLERPAKRAENEERLTHARQGHWDIAEGHVHKALEAAPTLAEVQFNLALTLSKLGKHDEAKEAFKQAAELASNNLETTESSHSRNTRVREWVEG